MTVENIFIYILDHLNDTMYCYTEETISKKNNLKNVSATPLMVLLF